jgi:hypothetical protein
MLRDYIMNNSFLRNVGLISGEIDNYPNTPGNFIPYFQYEIGPYKDDFILYFPKLPKSKLYYNFIFLKLWGYNPQDAVKFIEHHYEAYPNKKDLLLFLKRQLQHRATGLKDGSTRLSITTICLDWVNEELNSLKDGQRMIAYNQFIRQDLTFIIKNELQHIGSPSDANSAPSVDSLADRISFSLQAKMDSILENTESKIMALTDKYETSNILLTNATMKDKLIGLFLCLRDLAGKPSRRTKAADSLFSNMDLHDIAQILRTHFAPYKGIKIDTVERQVYKVSSKFRSENPAYPELSKALQKYFFNS